MTDDARWLIVGLGNPGSRYTSTRHNIGFRVVDSLAAAEDLRFKDSSRFKGEISLGRVSKRDVVLLKPQTYMNLSGESIGPVAHFYRIPIEQIIVIHDDVDLELGRIKVKQGGGHGGHNGLRSTSEILSDNEYMRVRFGVGRPPHPHQEVADFVLSDFYQEEQDLLEDTIKRSVKALRILMSRGLKEAMNRFNQGPKRSKKKEKAPETPDEAPVEEAKKSE